MAFDLNDVALTSLLQQQLLGLTSAAVPQDRTGAADRVEPEAAFHDFSSYRYLLTPQATSSAVGGAAGDSASSDVDLGTVYSFIQFCATFDSEIDADVADWIATDGSRMQLGGYDSSRPQAGEVSNAQVENAIRSAALDGFAAGMAPDLYERFVDSGEDPDLVEAACQAIGSWLSTSLPALQGTDGLYTQSALFSIGYAAFWLAGVPTVLAALTGFPTGVTTNSDDLDDDEPRRYPFDPVVADSVNLGLQLVYRQAWVPLGTQPGEIVRTLPLGPKQSEKISFKAIRKTKDTRQTEVVTSVESAMEGSAATKDSSEVVQEASEKFSWHAEASASASWGWGSASIKAGAAGEDASASKDAKSLINETMEKTASKIRRDTKIIVTSEVEVSSEFGQTSEISNPNDEIAVTYVYSRLQRQYELRTYLSEANQVVFVGEHLPAPSEITGSWIRRHDWILDRELLDSSFRADLESVREHAGVETTAEIDPRITRLMESLSGDSTAGTAGIPDYSDLPGEIPDLFSHQQGAYERELERTREQDLERRQYLRSLRRLRGHLCDNILHYCRAIWAAEDPESRIMRYAQIRVPIRWPFVGQPGSGTPTYGTFWPSVVNTASDTAPLSELVNPAGPIGFAGNYAIFYLRQSTRWDDILTMVDLLRAPFVSFDVAILTDSLDSRVGIRAAVSDRFTRPTSYRFVWRPTTAGAPLMEIAELAQGGTWAPVADVTVAAGQPVEVDALRVWLTDTQHLADGDAFQVRISPGSTLEDPELKNLRWSVAPLAEDKRASFFSPSVVADMRDYFTDVHGAFEGTPAGTGWTQATPAQRTILVGRYYDYLLRSRHTRRIVLDTNNLLLTREVDTATSLEPFKGLHRVLDVLNAGEALRGAALENTRKQRRLDADRLGDPDIEKVTVVASAPGLEDLAALDCLDGPDAGEGGDEAPGGGQG